jgi:hypothetical protein
VTAASEAERGETSIAPPVGGQKDDLFVTDPQPALDQQDVEASGANVEDDNNWCLYVRTPWENDVIVDCRDIEDFKEASRTIVRTLAVRTWTLILRSLSCIQDVL